MRMWHTDTHDAVLSWKYEPHVLYIEFGKIIIFMVWKSEKSHEIQCLWTLHVTEHLITVRQILSNLLQVVVYWGLIFLGFHQILGLQNKPNVPSLDRLNAHYWRYQKQRVIIYINLRKNYTRKKIKNNNKLFVYVILKVFNSFKFYFILFFYHIY